MTKQPNSGWSSLVAPPKGDLFGKSLASWRTSARETLGLPLKPIIAVGHQPEFFHPGVLAKFIAASQLAIQIDGVLVYLVVDHHIGTSGVIEVPNEDEEYLTASILKIANINPQVSMKDQARVTPISDDVFSKALNNASGDNAAMQFANATNLLMSPWATVDYCVSGTSLLETEIGEAIVGVMRRNPEACITAYNKAVKQFPHFGIATLDDHELPLWQGETNANVTTNFEDLRPRALLLTLLARLAIGDLFVHGTGGSRYDNIMEQWLFDWLGVYPCNTTMTTATLKLPLEVQSITDARSGFFNPQNLSEKKKMYLDLIDRSPQGSTERQLQFHAIHTWLDSVGTRPDIKAIRNSEEIANRRDWAFPLYPTEMIDELVDEITKDFVVAKLP